jgi:hypothetical protein
MTKKHQHDLCWPSSVLIITDTKNGHEHETHRHAPRTLSEGTKEVPIDQGKDFWIGANPLMETDEGVSEDTEEIEGFSLKALIGR